MSAVFSDYCECTVSPKTNSSNTSSFPGLFPQKMGVAWKSLGTSLPERTGADQARP